MLFCNVHLKQLTPQYLAPIADNREVPTTAQPSAKARVLSGVANAVTFLAKKEGRATDLSEAVRADAPVPGQGGKGGGDYGGGSDGSGKFELERNANIF